MGHSGWAFTFVSAAAGLTAATLVATPAQAATDCFPRAAKALYSSVARLPALPVAAPRPAVEGEAPERAATPPTHAAPTHRPVAHSGIYHVHHVSRPHPGLGHTPRRHAHAAAPQASPALAATGGDASTGAPGLIPAQAPSVACGTTPAAPPIGVGPVIAAQPAPALQGPILTPETTPIGTAVDTGTTTPDTDTDTTIRLPTPVIATDFPPQIVVTPGPRPSIPGGGVPEPASWTLMIAGLFGLGAALRRQRRCGISATGI
jgi:hypothetical protein